MAARHERVTKELDSVWGTLECSHLLEDLVFSDRPDRLGFTFDVMMELFALKNYHDKQYSQYTISEFDPFASVMDANTEDNGSHEGNKLEFSGTPGQEKVSQLKSNTLVEPLDNDDSPGSAIPAPGEVAGPGAEEVARLVVDESPPPPIEAASTKNGQWPAVRSLDELRLLQKKRAKGERVPKRDKRLIVEILKHYVDLSDADIEAAIKCQTNPGQGKKREPIGKALQQMGVISEETINRALCLQYGVIMVDLERFQIEAETMKLISSDVARSLRAIPVAVLDGILFLAVEKPFSFDQREYFTFLTKRKVELVMAPESQITQKLNEYGQGRVRSVQQGKEEFSSLAKKALGEVPGVELINEEVERDAVDTVTQDDASIVGLVNKIISDAAETGASDVHLESFYGDALAYIRFRRDGRMEEYSQYSASYHRAVVSRIKIMSNLDISERRMAQDGKITFARPGRDRMDLRVATIPTSRSIENVTIRLLHAGDPLPLETLKMSERDLAAFRRLILRPYGLILVCGPTGSGKTTTLHSALRELNTPDRKIWTAEDPIEIVQKKICQVQVHPKIGWTFATALRSFLRADPDVIMIGEMRDQETAKIAVEASMTGHVVLSTLHTNSASETAARLLDLDVDPFNLSDALIFILAQRLTRSLCKHCAKKYEMDPAEIEDLATEYYFSAYKRDPSEADRETIIEDWKQRLTKGAPLSLWKTKGCEECSMVGYKGRVALFELMEISPQLRELIVHKSPATRYQEIAVSQGMHTLKQDGIEKALLGYTDLSEVRGACN
jgi:type II secretory ATPase GspE/PulE/Tfp pilus assembly ATPase PilB-like protein